ncbi:MAG: hypothetical protein NTV34_09860 [Proteobacteria bacterium]|nr:hypothetical protein [Pseudomonadota bacterium]
MRKSQVVMAMYRPKQGKTADLESLVKKHFPVLKEYGLTTEHPPFIGRSTDGTIVEVFEWASPESAKKAHDHPAVAKIWEAMAMVCEFGKLEQLSEASKPFPHFDSAF